MFLLPVLDSSHHRPSPSSPAHSVGSYHFLPLLTLSFPVLGRHLGPCVKMAPPAPARGRAQEGQRSCARTCSGAGRWGGDVRRRPAPGGRSTPGPTPPSSHPANPEVEEEARRRWQSGRSWWIHTRQRVWGWGRGVGLSGLGSLAWTGRGRPWPRQSCRGSTRSWLRSTLRYPSYAGSRGSPVLRPRVALAATCPDRGRRRRGHASAPLLSPPSVSTITALPPAVPRRWGRAVSGRCAVLREGAGVWFFLLIELAGLERDVRNPGFRFWCWSGGAGKGEDHRFPAASSISQPGDGKDQAFSFPTGMIWG